MALSVPARRPVPSILPPLAVACLALACAGCASGPSTKAEALQEGEPHVLNRDCKLLGTVEGRSVFGGMSDEAKLKGAVANVREKAAAMGATHIYMLKTSVTGVMGIGEASARAFRCDTKP